MYDRERLRAFLGEGDVLILVPPYAQLQYAHLGAHALQAAAREAGFKVRVLYANLLWAAAIGCGRYDLFLTCGEVLLGERSFARAAFGTEAWGRNAKEVFEALTSLDQAGRLGMASARLSADLAERLEEVEPLAPGWADELAEVIAQSSFKIVGATTSVEQTAASIALLKRIKARNPAITTIIGGANCDGEMADQVAELDPGIDYVFSGESDLTFPAFLEDFAAGTLPEGRIVRGEPVTFMDGLPLPTYDEFFEQHRSCLSGPGHAPESDMIPYETSRGCWWGQKHHCTFCGINGAGMGFRDKSPDLALEQMRRLREGYGNLQMFLADAIMPWSYRKTLLQSLAQEEPRFHLAYEVKSNLSLQDVLLLRAAGVNWIVPGIEALSSGLLKLMKKGVLARQNLALMRYARLAKINVDWSLLLGFPNDAVEDYEQTLDLIPLLHHLQPPKGAFPFVMARFSPYFNRPEEHGITGVRPLASYADVFPENVHLMDFAYNFEGDYESCFWRYPDLRQAIEAAVAAWRAHWSSRVRSTVMLRATAFEDGRVAISDTRGLPGTEDFYLLPHEQAVRVLTQRPLRAVSDSEAWAVEKRLGVIVDDFYVPLATASPRLLLALEAEAQDERRAVAA